jgi:hypothetical protein
MPTNWEPQSIPTASSSQSLRRARASTGASAATTTTPQAPRTSAVDLGVLSIAQHSAAGGDLNAKKDGSTWATWSSDSRIIRGAARNRSETKRRLFGSFAGHRAAAFTGRYVVGYCMRSARFACINGNKHEVRRIIESLDSSMGAVLHRHSKKYKMKSGQPLVRPNAAMLEYILTDLEPFLTTELLTPYQVLRHQRNHFKWAKMRLARSTAQQNSFYAVVCQSARRLKRKQPTMESARVAQRLIFGKYFDLRYNEFLVTKKLKSTDRATALHLRGMLKSNVSAIMADKKIAVQATFAAQAAQREEPSGDVWLGVVALRGHQKVISKNVPLTDKHTPEQWARGTWEVRVQWQDAKGKTLPMSQSSYEALNDVAQDVYGMVEAYVNSVESESDQIAMRAVMQTHAWPPTEAWAS